MIELKGKYNKANVMIDDIDIETRLQILGLLNHPVFAKTYIAIMPDCHAGAGAVIGFTAKLNDYIIPNIVGVDIGCGVECYPVGKMKIDLQRLDSFISESVPTGFHRRSSAHEFVSRYHSMELENALAISSESDVNVGEDVVCNSLGTLGGGNHFIEVDQSETGEQWLSIHTGSRNFGLKVANYWQAEAKDLLAKMLITNNAAGLEYLPSGMGMAGYLADMEIAQQYAVANRSIIARGVLEGFFGIPYEESDAASIKSVHNYIDQGEGIIRKGAIAAHDGEKVVIPLNMRDGVIFGIGKGSSKWNFSAPHGAGRLMSRKAAKANLSVSEFQETMEGVYSSTVNANTLDEAPMAYKPSSIIIDAIAETVDVLEIVKPIYNRKDAGK